MSGGSLDYVFADVMNAVNTSNSLNQDQRELVEDVADLLHDVEWSASGDRGPDEWEGSVREFVDKWDVKLSDATK